MHKVLPPLPEERKTAQKKPCLKGGKGL